MAAKTASASSRPRTASRVSTAPTDGTLSVLLLSSTFDIGGQGWRIHQAFRRLEPDWDVRSVSASTSYLNYPVDLPYRRQAVEELYQKADLIHCRVKFTEYDRLAAKFGPKPVLIHYHGSAFRSDPHRYLREQRQRNAIGLVSTLDLWLLAPDELIWLPAPYDLDALAALVRR